MKMTTAATCLLLAGVLAGAVALAQDADSDRAHPKAFVRDSVITTKIKSKLAAEQITSLGRIHVDTDASGVVWLSGSARSQEALERAMSIARETDGVKGVKSTLKVRQDD
jgi:hyperosmotically inducible protein